MRKLITAPRAAVSLTILLLLSPVCVIAANNDSTNASTKPMEIIISASRIEQPAENVGSSVIVLSGDELKARGVEFVADALLEVPSLVVTSQGPRGSKTQLRVRGNEASHVLILIDGMRVSDVASGEFDFANLQLDDVEKIEVLLGPQSTLYGSDAIAGVVSITTLKGGRGPAGQLQISKSSLNTRSGMIHMESGDNGLHYSVTANHDRTDGISAASEKNGNTETDAYEANAVNVKAGYDHKRFRTWAIYKESNSDYEYDSDDYITGLAIDDPDNKQRLDTKAVSWAMTLPLVNNRLNNQLQLTRTNYDYDSISSGSQYVTQSERDNIEYQGSYSLNKTGTLQFGADFINEKLMVNGYSTFDKSANRRGTYLQWIASFKGINLTLGGRSDDHESFGRHTTFRETASYSIDKQWRIRGSHGTGFKAPSLQELYDTGSGGNADLNPEETSSIEVGVDYTNNGLHSDITLFSQKVEELIRYVGNWPTGKLVNVDDARSKGVELSLAGTWESFKVNTAITWTDATETVAGVERERYRVPAWSSNVLATYYYGKGRFWVQEVFRGQRRDLNFALGQDVTLNSYRLLNLGVSYQLDDNTSLSARIDNLTDEYYEEVYSYGTRGRTATVTVDWRF